MVITAVISTARSGCLLHFTFNGQVRRENNLKQLMVQSDCSGRVFMLVGGEERGQMDLCQVVI